MKLRKVQKRQPCLTRAQVIDVARMHFIDGETMASIAEALAVSPSYLGRLVKAGRGVVYDVKVVAR